jgi:hypothetical protein
VKLPVRFRSADRGPVIASINSRLTGLDHDLRRSALDARIDSDDDHSNRSHERNGDDLEMRVATCGPK